MNRRRFLKYAGVTAAVVGASALGLNYVSQPSPSMTSPTTSTTLVPRRITTSVSLSTSTESVQLASLQGRLFFDYNGNGVQGGEEPAVAGALVQLNDNVGNVIAETLTDSSGDYRLEDVRTGSYKLHLGVDHFSDKQLTYMCTSPDEFRAVTEDYQLSLQENVNMDIGLMEGFLTLPFMRGTKYAIYTYNDLDPARGRVRNWRGQTGIVKEEPKDRPGAYDNATLIQDDHEEIDFKCDEGTAVVAAAPGEVDSAMILPDGGLNLVIDHGNRFKTSYGHLSKFLVGKGETIKRGQVVALSGNTGNSGFPHLHFGFYWLDKPSPSQPRPFSDPYSIDPFRDVTGSSGINYWTKDNDPQYADT